MVEEKEMGYRDTWRAEDPISIKQAAFSIIMKTLL